MLVVGGTGLIGQETVSRLSENTHAYKVISFGHHKNFECLSYAGDVTDFDTLELVYKKHCPDVTLIMYGLSSIACSYDSRRYVLNDFFGVLNILRCCEKYGCGKVVYLSSAAVYSGGERISENHEIFPRSFYAKIKISMEKILEMYRVAGILNYVVLRCFNVVGGNGIRAGRDIISITSREKSVRVFGTSFSTPDGTLIRDYVYIGDVASAVERALEFNGSGTFNIGTGVGYSVLEVISVFQKITGARIEILNEARRSFDPEILVADVSRAERILHWSPEYSLVDSVEEIVRKKSSGRAIFSNMS